MKKTYPDWFEPYFARTWPEIESNLYKSFATTKSLLLYIMAIALLVAAMNLSSALYTFTLEHRAEIAVLRSFGVKNAQIMRVFTIDGFLTGLLGTIGGTIIGITIYLNVNSLIAFFDWIINLALGAFASHQFSTAAIRFRLLDPKYYLTAIPIDINWGQVGAIAGLSVGLCVVVAILPAKKALKSSPLELIKKI